MGQSDKYIKDLSIAHEINQPVTAINMLTKISLERLKDDTGNNKDEVIKHLQEIIKQSKRCAEIVQNVKKRNIKHSGENQKVDLNQFLIEIIEEFRITHKGLDIIINKKLMAGLPLVEGNYTSFSELFSNLIENACDAMKDSDVKILSVSTNSKFNEVQVEISDSGCGISMKDKNRVFDSGFTTKENDGMGLGLHISKKIVEKYNGTISLRGERNNGTSFYVTFPVCNILKEKKKPRKDVPFLN